MQQQEVKEDLFTSPLSLGEVKEFRVEVVGFFVA